ncbi:MAG: GNAT family N-acetyltransferase, partial [Clostridia bacterium]|nr:GNAT family N-acetyltransferase [Clostridia bacterium]
MNHCGTQTIETERLILRRFRPEDADAMYRNWASDPEVTKYLMWPTHDSPEVSRAVTESWVKEYGNPDHYQWAITVKANGEEPIGDIAVVDRNKKAESLHIGYCIGRAWWHQGIMSEALQAVMDYLFDTVGVNRIEARHDPRNPHSG